MQSDGGMEGMTEAPCYFPTAAQFEEPLKYIAQIRPEAEQYGICRICPPAGWKPPFAHKPDKLRFSTKEQDLVRDCAAIDLRLVSRSCHDAVGTRACRVRISFRSSVFPFFYLQSYLLVVQQLYNRGSFQVAFLFT